MYFMLCVTVNSFNVVDNVEITLSVNELILLKLRMKMGIKLYEYKRDAVS